MAARRSAAPAKSAARRSLEPRVVRCAAFVRPKPSSSSVDCSCGASSRGVKPASYSSRQKSFRGFANAAPAAADARPGLMPQKIASRPGPRTSGTALSIARDSVRGGRSKTSGARSSGCPARGRHNGGGAPTATEAGDEERAAAKSCTRASRGLVDVLVHEGETVEERLSHLRLGERRSTRDARPERQHGDERVALAVEALVALPLAQRPQPFFHASPR